MSATTTRLHRSELFWDRLDGLTDHWDVLRHPFYRRWANGRLARTDLAFYAGQHHHALLATARLSEHAACVAPDLPLWDELEVHAANARRRCETWRGFAAAVGADTVVAATQNTSDCLRLWAPQRGGSLMRTAIAVYVIQAPEPRLAGLKRTALTAHYGIDEPRALAHFNGCVRLAADHAEHARSVIASYLTEDMEQRLIIEAERVLRAHWGFLDGLERR